MSVIFGVLHLSSKPVDAVSLLHLASLTDHFGPDGTRFAVDGCVGMVCQAFHTTTHSRRDVQPKTNPQGHMLAFDGRLDNRVSLTEQLSLEPHAATDSTIVLEAFRRWGIGCLTRLIGDWALALWDGSRRVLYLARDHAGSRSLFFRCNSKEVSWSTHLETLLGMSDDLSLDEGFVARTLSGFVKGDITPYRGLRSVQPAHYVQIENGDVCVKAHWNWFPSGQIRYRSDHEYDEHFLSLFERSVERRLDSTSPILAELSGGMDSSSIVCMSDVVSERSQTVQRQIDTVSYFDASEPNWDEHRFFGLIEEQRGKRGFHLDLAQVPMQFESVQGCSMAIPGLSSAALGWERYFEDVVGSAHKVILSGIGGDELLGGVPTPFPELAQLLSECRLRSFLQRSVQWCIVTRTPLWHLFFKTASFLASLWVNPDSVRRPVPPWLTRRMRLELPRRLSYDPPPSSASHSPVAIANARAWWAILETLPHTKPRIALRHEYRYPYLDRDLVEFLHRVPRQQLMQPGRRRVLMRRALKGIVPDGILERRRKAFVIRAPLEALQRSESTLEGLLTNSLLAELGFVHVARLRTALEQTLRGDPKWLGALIRTFGMELWLRACGSGYPLGCREQVSFHGRSFHLERP
jgi:asparagine synthase (glutamine-hydrolysing)